MEIWSDMMRAEGVTEKGHLQINRNVIHEPDGAAWRIDWLLRNIRSIVRLISRHCLLSWSCARRAAGKRSLRWTLVSRRLYGVLLLRLQKKEISQGTAKAMEAISSFVSLLANYYDKEKRGELELMDN